MPFLKSLFGAWENLLLFVPYYFSTPLLLRTFFYPWKREFWLKKKPGFHPLEVLERLSSNLLSRLIGAFLRFWIIFAGILAEILVFLFGLPFLFLFLFLTSIIQLLTSNFPSRRQEEKAKLAKEYFSLRRLLAVRPLASDWHFGYTPTLDKYAQIPTYSDYDRRSSKHVFLVGREKEIAQIKRVLNRERENNLLLVGEPGSGRHAIIHHLARTLFSYRFVFFDLISLFKDKKTTVEQRGALEEILAEAAAAGNIVLVINDFEKYTDFADVWEKFLAESELGFIGITTPSAYHQKIFPNKTLMKYLRILEVSPLNREQVLEVLKNRAASLKDDPFPHQLLETILAASYQAAILEDKHQPEAALDLLEEFLASTFQKSYHKSHDRDKKLTLKESLKKFLEEKLKVPGGKIAAREKEKLTNLEALLHEQIINQEEAISQVANALRRRRLHLSQETKPIGSFLFLGPTGVGKTETAKALAVIFFEEEKKLLRFDMARFQDKSQVAQLIQELAQAIREQPYSVLLLDEIEKAHHDLLNLFLTIIDEGYFHDQDNNRVPCQNLIIIGTSNAASEFIRERVVGKTKRVTRVEGLPTRRSSPIQAASIGGKETRGRTRSEEMVLDYILRQNIFSPEFLNRFDSLVVYQPLTDEHLRQIARLKLEKLRKRLQEEHQKTFEITEELLEQIVKEGSYPEFGAREIERTIKRLVEDKLAQELLK